jgi:hypothetical protein
MPDDPAQYKRFLEAAREAGAIDAAAVADQAFKTVVRKRTKRPAKAKRKKSKR